MELLIWIRYNHACYLKQIQGKFLNSLHLIYTWPFKLEDHGELCQRVRRIIFDERTYAEVRSGKSGNEL